MPLLTRPAADDEAIGVRRSALGSHAVRDRAEFDACRAAAPHLMRVTDRGEGALLTPWRLEGDTLAIAGLWSARDRLAAIAHDLRRVAGSFGWARVFSPLVGPGEADAYRAGGFEHLEHIVAYTRALERREAGPPDTGPVRCAVAEDVCGIAAVDLGAFEEPWRLGVADVERLLASDHVVVAEGACGIQGYAAASLRGSTVSLGRIAVARPARRHGVASALLSHVVAWASSTGALGLSLCTQASNEGSRAFYASAGMREHDTELLMLRADALGV